MAKQSFAVHGHKKAFNDLIFLLENVHKQTNKQTNKWQPHANIKKESEKKMVKSHTTRV